MYLFIILLVYLSTDTRGRVSSGKKTVPRPSTQKKRYYAKPTLIVLNLTHEQEEKERNKQKQQQLALTGTIWQNESHIHQTNQT